MKFFRKIRRQFLKNNKFSNYLLYATGEVFLIVMGILIALALNNWNQNRIIKEKEHFYLEGLKGEFKRSKYKLEKLIDVNRLNYEESIKLAEQLDNAPQEIEEQELSGLLYNSLSYEIAYNPNNSLLNELINSGGLEDISNPELRMYLTNWESVIQSIHRQENSLRIQREKILDMFRADSGSIRTIFDHTGVSAEMGFKKKEDNFSNMNILVSREFENNLLMFLTTGKATENSHYNPLLEEIDIILGLIDAELKMRS
ncbi:DUF6090 family protein [Zunongwangia sp. F363]|uniref:DUF6090 family protein n=1 Tax=Autumnicola tepida TaxID=3075595 RepID=A0ABU3C652_9FLAO|nr:DUF6090 family protein [Zunongwangia sp. F363]MDT0641821.1 DUF6090 family protein [Zunongwangia sp. F363]